MNKDRQINYRIVKFFLRFCAIIPLCLCSIVLYPDFAISNTSVVVDRIVAVINDEIILLSELNHAFKPYTDQIEKKVSYEEKRELSFNIRNQILNRLIDQKLTDHEVKRRRISISEQEIDNAIERMKEANYYTDEELVEILADQGFTMDEYRMEMEKEILRSKLIAQEVKSKIVVTKEEIEEYYHNNKEKYGEKKEYHLSNIIMKVPEFADSQEKLKIKLQMEQILKKIETEKTFNSENINAQTMDLGLIEFDSLSPQIKTAVTGLGPGDFTPVLDTDVGFQIFLIKDVKTIPGKSVEHVSAEIEAYLYKDKFNKKMVAWLEDLRKGSHIKIIK